jgi:hypothetical protein
MRFWFRDFQIVWAAIITYIGSFTNQLAAATRPDWGFAVLCILWYLGTPTGSSAAWPAGRRGDPLIDPRPKARGSHSDR